jgi:parallel beta-helix repeat protein
MALTGGMSLALSLLSAVPEASARVRPPATPRGVHAVAIDSNTAIVLWKPVRGASRYRVYRDGALHARRKHAVSVLDVSLATGGRRRYAVAACRRSRCSPRSAAVSVPTLGPCSGVTIGASQDIQATIDANPPGTTLCLQAGTFALTAPLVPKSGDVLWGASGTVLTGQDVTRQAIVGRTGLQDDVTVRGLRIEHFAGPGAAVSPGLSWLVEHNVIANNADVGLQVASGMTARGNSILRTGRLGVGGHDVSDVTIEANRIAENNTKGLYVDRAGGTKLLYATNVLFQGNRVLYNAGNGLHCDTDCNHVSFVGNVVTDNFGKGISYETSWNGVIRGNTVIGNDARAAWLPLPYGSNLRLNDSQGVEISGNVVKATVPGTNGITLYDRDRGAGPLGTYRIANDYIHDNTVYMHAGGASGLAGTAHNPTAPSAGVRFENNTYYVDEPGLYFDWGSDPISWGAWRAAGNDVTGSFLPW